MAHHSGLFDPLFRQDNDGQSFHGLGCSPLSSPGWVNSFLHVLKTCNLADSSLCGSDNGVSMTLPPSHASRRRADSNKSPSVAVDLQTNEIAEAELTHLETKASFTNISRRCPTYTAEGGSGYLKRTGPYSSSIQCCLVNACANIFPTVTTPHSSTVCGNLQHECRNTVLNPPVRKRFQ